MVPANPHLQHHHHMTSVIPKNLPCSLPTLDCGLEHLSADECPYSPFCSSCLGIKAGPGNQRHVSDAPSAEELRMSSSRMECPCHGLTTGMAHWPSSTPYRPPSTPSGTRKHMSKVNPGDWFCWEAPFNTGTGQFGVCGLGCYRTTIPRVTGSLMGTCCHPLQALPCVCLLWCHGQGQGTVFAGWQQWDGETCCLAGFLFGRVFKGVLQGVPALASTLLSQVPSPKGACCSRCGV